MNPSDRRARTIVTTEGKFLNLPDIKEALKDDGFVDECAEMIMVGKMMNASATEIVRRVIGCAMLILSGEESIAQDKS